MLSRKKWIECKRKDKRKNETKICLNRVEKKVRVKISIELKIDIDINTENSLFCCRVTESLL